MSFLFVDRVWELERDRSIVAARQISVGEEVFREHFPGRPMMPASLLIEASAQAATILLEVSCGFTHKAFVGYVTNAKFRAPVVPGYEMRLEMNVVSADTAGAILKGRILQRDRRCANLEIGMVTSPLREFIPAEVLAHYLALYGYLLAETQFVGFEQDPRERLNDVRS